MATRIKSYISTSVDITPASTHDVSKVEALQVLNQIFSPKVIVWWQPKAEMKVHYLAVFETADAAKGALDKHHDDWVVAPLNEAGKRTLGASLEKTIKLYPTTFRRPRAPRSPVSGRPSGTAPAPQATSTRESNLPLIAPAPFPASQPPPVPATFPAPPTDPLQVAVDAAPNTIDAVVDRAGAVDKAVRALLSQKELILQQRNQLLARTQELELALNSAQEEITALKGRATHQEKENERLQTIIDSQPPKPTTCDVAVEASPQGNDAIPPKVVRELKELYLAQFQKDIALAEKEKVVQEISRALEEEVTKRKAVEGERDNLIAERDRQSARIPAVIELFLELEKMAAMAFNRREDKGKEKEAC